MPELPEVEAARRGISEQLAGKNIGSVELFLPKLVIAPVGWSIDMLVGRQIDSVDRHGKYLTLRFGDIAAVAHLKLSGQAIGRGESIAGFAAGHPVPAFDAPMPHKSTHLILTFEDGSKLYLTDIRHFARVQLMPVDEVAPFFAALKMGPDAISPEFNHDWFRQAIGRRKIARLKPLLLDQKFMAGIGNIYVDEALHHARLHPETLASSLSEEGIERLYDAIVAIMELAVPIAGAKILNGKALTEHGEFPFVHGREGAPCLTCGGAIVKTRVNNRGTYLCLACQPVP
ncbi:MAG: DNA-formamidopyrimidine glycosylase [Chloroflexia bacterium]|jgi:formamidopyrimidine-DNA glycosylase|nr:DNA-formamidopyrimidine glycosylase [Chloroflexia bacterium]